MGDTSCLSTLFSSSKKIPLTVTIAQIINSIPPFTQTKGTMSNFGKIDSLILSSAEVVFPVSY